MYDWINGSYVTIGSASSAADALKVCMAYSGLKKGVCGWERDTYKVDFSAGGKVYTSYYADLHASVCS
jgi:hypothetical protein